jgi:hypothetical protein
VRALVCAGDLGEAAQLAPEPAAIERLRVQGGLHLLDQQYEVENAGVLCG